MNMMYILVIIVWTTYYSKRTIVGFTTQTTFKVRLPAGDDQTSSLHLIVRIRDTQECITEFNLSSVRVAVDSAGIADLVNALQSLSSSALANNPFVRLLASGNQNTVGQVTSALAQEFNRKSSESLNSAASSRRAFDALIKAQSIDLF